MNNNNCLSCPDKENIYFDLGNCINNCKNGFFIDSNNIKICKCTHNKKCYTCNEESNILDLCVDCNSEAGYFETNDNKDTIDGFVNCFKNPEGYYLSNNIYHKCYYTCKFCTTFGNEYNHNCIFCLDEYILIKDFHDIYNCYEICNFYYYYDKENNNKYKCTSESNCPEKYKKLVN